MPHAHPSNFPLFKERNLKTKKIFLKITSTSFFSTNSDVLLPYVIDWPWRVYDPENRDISQTNLTIF